MYQDTENGNKRQQAQLKSAQIEAKLFGHLQTLLGVLDQLLDRRLVVTFFGLMLALICHRHRNEGGWLSQLGSYLVPENAEAGRKRIERLLYSRKWDSQVLVEGLWRQADRVVEQAAEEHEPMLVIWDESVVEKPESLKLEGLGPVRSSKAARLKRIKPGYFNPPGGRPVFVPGFHWLQLIVCPLQGAVSLAHQRFWTTRGDLASSKREEEQQVLRETTDRWGAAVIHVWDRGFAGTPWLTQAFLHAARFVLRWPKNYTLLDEHGQPKKAWEIARGKRSWIKRKIWDARRQCEREIGVVAVPVFDPTFQQPLWLVVSRQGPGKTPWYLLTTEPILTPEHAWRVILMYARRWQIEMALRFDKAELGFESLRVFSEEVRQRLFQILALAHAFFLQFLTPDLETLRIYLLDTWCHRTGKRSRNVRAPLYRLRFALAFFWSRFPPPFFARLNSG
jgi:hypothetical protein